MYMFVYVTTPFFCSFFPSFILIVNWNLSIINTTLWFPIEAYTLRFLFIIRRVWTGDTRTQDGFVSKRGRRGFVPRMDSRSIQF